METPTWNSAKCAKVAAMFAFIGLVLGMIALFV